MLRGLEMQLEGCLVQCLAVVSMQKVFATTVAVLCLQADGLCSVGMWLLWGGGYSGKVA